jgi:hypothetical protein
MNVTQKVGKKVSLFLPHIWYICSWNGAVIVTEGAFRSVGLHWQSIYHASILSSTRPIRLVLLFLLIASPRQVALTWGCGNQMACLQTKPTGCWSPPHSSVKELEHRQKAGEFNGLPVNT